MKLFLLVRWMSIQSVGYIRCDLCVHTSICVPPSTCLRSLTVWGLVHPSPFAPPEEECNWEQRAGVSGSHAGWPAIASDTGQYRRKTACQPVKWTGQSGMWPPPPLCPSCGRRRGECSVRTRLVSIPLSSPSLLRTCYWRGQQTEREAGVRRVKGWESERQKGTMVA